MALQLDEAQEGRPYAVPDGPKRRHTLLKMNYLGQVPAITIHRARAITEVDRENPGQPRILLRALAFLEQAQAVFADAGLPVAVVRH